MILNQPKKSWKKTISISTLISLSTLAILELGFRFTNFPTSAALVVFSGEGNPDTWFKRNDNQVYPTYQHQLTGQFPIHAKSKRIAVLGGSVVHGGSINMTAENEFPSLLDVNATVYNLANPSLDSHDQLSILTELAAYPMDAWVVTTGHNDFGNTYLHQRYAFWPTGFLGQLGRIKERLKLTHFVRRWTNAPPINSSMPDPNRQFAAPKVSPNQKEWALLHYKMNIDSMIALAAEKQVPLVFLVPPRALTRAPIGACTSETNCANDLWNEGMEAKDLAKLSQASDADTIPFRIHSEAQAHLRSKGVLDNVWVIDAEALLPQDEDGLGPDISLFQDHVHFKMKGHQSMATIASPIVKEALNP